MHSRWVFKRGKAPLFSFPLSLIKRGGLRGRDFLLDKQSLQRVKYSCIKYLGDDSGNRHLEG